MCDIIQNWHSSNKVKKKKNHHWSSSTVLVSSAQRYQAEITLKVKYQHTLSFYVTFYRHEWLWTIKIYMIWYTCPNICKKKKKVCSLHSHTYLDFPHACSGRGWCKPPSVWLRKDTRSTQVPWAHGETAGQASAILGSKWHVADPYGVTPAGAHLEIWG